MSDTTETVETPEQESQVDAPETDVKESETSETPDAEAGKPELTVEEYKAEISKVRGEAAQRRTQVRDLEAKLKDAKTPEEHEAAIKEYVDKVAVLEAEILKRDVASEYKLPAALAKRLTGSTKEELEADAKELATLIPNNDEEDDTDLRGGLDPRVDGKSLDNLSPAELAKLHRDRRL